MPLELGRRLISAHMPNSMIRPVMGIVRVVGMLCGNCSELLASTGEVGKLSLSVVVAVGNARSHPAPASQAHQRRWRRTRQGVGEQVAADIKPEK